MPSSERVLLGQRFGLLGGVALTTGAAVGFSVVLTRLYSAVLGHHFAFLAISLALFGAGLGGGLVAMFPGLARPPNLLARLATLAGLASAATVVAAIQTLRMKPVDTIDGESLGRLAVLYLMSVVPFTLVGVVVAGSLRHARGSASVVYFADMIGAALGGVLGLSLLRLGAPRAALALAMALGLAAVVFAVGSRDPRGKLVRGDRPGGGWSAAAFFLSSISLFAGDYGEQWLTVSTLRYVNLDRAHFVGWSELALVTVDRPSRGMAWMRVDASAATAILDDKTPPVKHPDAMAYALTGIEGPTLVIGAGGGRDVRAALAAGQTQIVAVEINRMVASDVMLGKLKDYSGGLFARPEVELVVADGRSYIRGSDRRFRAIVFTLVDTWAAASVGGLALSEDGLYTVEAFEDYLDHLDDQGVIVVNRWDAEADRLIALASAGLRAAGVADPRQHLYACSHTRSTALLVKKSPLAPEELAKLRKFCVGSRFVEVFAPDRPGTELRAQLAADPWGASRAAAGPDLTPPTDDRPYFFHTLRGRDLLATLRDSERLASEQRGVASLVAAFVVSAASAAIFFVIPPLFRPRELVRPRGGGQRVRTVLFFAAIGVGFVFVELAIVQIFTTFLGHPVYALTTVLVALLAATGVGALLVRNVKPEDAADVARRRGAMLVVGLAASAALLLPLTSALVGLPFAVRVIIAAIALAPLGLLMGAFAPIGVAIASSRSGTMVAWGWALNGFFGVTATAAGTLIAMHIGFSYLLLLGALAYFVAAAIVPEAAPGPGSAARDIEENEDLELSGS